MAIASEKLAGKEAPDGVKSLSANLAEDLGEFSKADLKKKAKNNET